MPSPWGQSSHMHDNYKLQKEIERVGLQGGAKGILGKLGDFLSSVFPKGGNTKDIEKFFKSLWALTTRLNKKVVGRPKVVQSLNFDGVFSTDYVSRPNFEELSPVMFVLIPENCPPELTSEPDKPGNYQETTIKGYVKTEDIKVKVLHNDTKADYLFHKLYAGTGINFEILNNNGYQKLKISSNVEGVLNTGVHELYFDYNDISDTGYIPIGNVSNCMIEFIQLEVITAFDQSPYVTCGDNILNARLMRSDESKLTVKNKYYVHHTYLYDDESEIRLYYGNNSSNPTVGEGRIIVFYTGI